MANGYAPILAIDFDGTIKKSKDFKEYGELQDGCYDTLKCLQYLGCKLVLWTCRTGELLDKAKDYLKENGLYDLFLTCNENVPGMFESSNKIYADYYIDDLNIGGFIGWNKVKEIVLKDDYFKYLNDEKIPYPYFVGDYEKELILNEKQTKEELETNKEKMAEFYKGYKCPGYFEEVNKHE